VKDPVTSDRRRRQALRQFLLNRNPNTQVAIMMIACDLRLETGCDISAAVEKACSFWDASLRDHTRRHLTWELEERIAESFIRGLRRANSGWRQILERGAQ